MVKKVIKYYIFLSMLLSFDLIMTLDQLRNVVVFLTFSTLFNIFKVSKMLTKGVLSQLFVVKYFEKHTKKTQFSGAFWVRFRARKVFGAFEKRTLGYQCFRFCAGTRVARNTLGCLKEPKTTE